LADSLVFYDQPVEAPLIFESLFDVHQNLNLTRNRVHENPLRGQKLVYLDISAEVDQLSELIAIFSDSEVAIASPENVLTGKIFHWIVQTNFVAPKFMFGLNALVQSGIHGR